jgi:putative nucleotidyltransferase with HDIG domain
MSLHPRIRQGFDHLLRRSSPPELPADALATLPYAVVARFRTLPVADQRHLVATYRLLRESGADDATCLAGLLHDIGKTDGRRSARTVDRVANVVLRRWLPGWQANLAARTSPPPLLRGPWLAAAHARLGAEWLRQHGCDERVCRLVEAHEPGGQDGDAHVRALIAADDAATSACPHYGEAVGQSVLSPTAHGERVSPC